MKRLRLGGWAAVLAAGALAAPAAAQDDIASLAAALDAAEAELAAVEGELGQQQEQLAAAERAAAPAVKRAAAAAERAARAEARVEDSAAALERDRERAAEEISAAEAAYQSDRDDRDAAITGGLIALALGAALALAALIAAKAGSWQPSGWRRLAAIALPALLVLGGAGSLLGAPAAEEPEISAEAGRLAELAGTDPLDEPDAELARLIEQAEPLLAEAERLEAQSREALAPARELEERISASKRALDQAEDRVSEASEDLEAAEAEAAEEAEFRAEATTIDYDQLIKSPEEYRGTKVVYEGQIFQIQESYGRSIILLSVTNEGYGFWTDEIWVDAGEIASAEDDVITVYGTVTGTKTYQTQIGGSRYVPRVKAKYIDE